MKKTLFPAGILTLVLLFSGTPVEADQTLRFTVIGIDCPPATVRWAAGPTAAIGTTGLALQYAGQYQSIGKWSGDVDEGTGFHNGGVFREVYSESLSDESFRQGTTYAIVLTRFFSR